MSPRLRISLAVPCLICAAAWQLGCGAGGAQLPEGCARFEGTGGHVIYLCDEETHAPLDLSHRYVRIDDLSANGDTADAGSDIDAILLRKGASSHFARHVEAFTHGSGFEQASDPQNALGEPDAFTRWESADPVCELSEGLVSLGGRGGFLIVGFDVDIEPGDTLIVLEAGGCTGNDGAVGHPDAIEIAISAGNAPDGSWSFVTSGDGPLISEIVPRLPYFSVPPPPR